MIFVSYFLEGRWFSKILRNILGWYVKMLTIPYRGGWVVWKRPKTPLRNIKMAPNEHILSYKTAPKNTFTGEMVAILFCRAILRMQYVLGIHHSF